MGVGDHDTRHPIRVTSKKGPRAPRIGTRERNEALRRIARGPQPHGKGWSFEMSFLAHRLLLARGPVFEHTWTVVLFVDLNSRQQAFGQDTSATLGRPSERSRTKTFSACLSQRTASSARRSDPFNLLPQNYWTGERNPRSGVNPTLVRSRCARMRANCTPMEAGRHSCSPNSLVDPVFLVSGAPRPFYQTTTARIGSER
jgi:hypothetical protein